MTTTPERPEKVTFSLLQIFRGWAAVLVILVHVSWITYDKYSTVFLKNYFAMGAAGVDFFFVLSGFLICHIHLKDIGRPKQTIPYLTKRLIRIYPIYWLVTLVILPTYFLVPNYGQGDETHPAIIAGSFLLYPISRAPILVAGWTLCHEMLFYFIFAFLIGVRSRWALGGALLWACGVFASVIFAFNEPINYTGPVHHLFFWPQNLEFILGCIAAFIFARMNILNISQAQRRLCLTLLALGIFAFLLTGLLTEDFLNIQLGKHVLVYGALSFLIVITSALIDRSGGLSPACVNNFAYRAMHYMGNASYSIYLVHGPCLSATFKLLSHHNFITKIGVIPATWMIIIFTILVGCACHAFVEQPLLDWLRRTMLPRKIPATAPSGVP